MNHVACCFGMGGLAFLLLPLLLVSLLIKWAKTCACDGVRLRGRNTSSLTCRSLFLSLTLRPTLPPCAARAAFIPHKITTCDNFD